MPSNKNRVYIALFARAGKPKMPGLEDQYHWGILIGPKTDSKDAEGRLFHAKEKMTLKEDGPQSVWHFEERAIRMAPSAMSLARILFGKVADEKRLVSIMEATPIRATELGWNCVVWVKEVLASLEADGKALGTSVTTWDLIRKTAMDYVESKKAQHRYDGQGQFDAFRVATWSMLDRKEVFA